MKLQNLITGLAVVLLSTAAMAHETTKKTTTTTRQTTSSPSGGSSTDMSGSSTDMEGSTGRSMATRMATTTNPTGWIPSISLGFGRMDQNGNSDQDGDAISASLVGSYYFDNSNWIGDAALGIHKQYFSDSQPTAGLLSLGGRYEFGNRFSIGPVVDMLFGTTDAFGSANNYFTLVGVQGFREITFRNDQMVRLGLKFSTEFGINDQTSNLVSVVAQWGVGAANPIVQRANVSMD